MARASSTGFIVLIITVLAISVRSVSALPDNVFYRAGDHIPLFANKLRARNDHCDRGSYFDLPFCSPGNKITNRSKSLEEVLEGDCFRKTRYKLQFKVFKIGKILCEKNLTKDEVAKFRNAVKRDYQFQMSFNNILVWSSVGQVDNTSYSRPSYYLFRHTNFHVYYFRSQVLYLEVMGDPEFAVDITEDASIKINFTYSVFWNKYKIELDQYTRLINEYGRPVKEGGKGFLSYLYCVGLICVWLTIFITLFYALIRACLSAAAYFTRTNNGHMEEEVQEELPVTLMQIHGEECSCPPFTDLLGAIMGNGIQQLILIGLLFGLVYQDKLSPCYRDSLFPNIFLIYGGTSIISGVTATFFHSRYTSAGQKQCVLLTGTLYLVPSLFMFMFVNTVSKLTRDYTTLPQLDKVLVSALSIWAILTASFLNLGGMIGYSLWPNPQPPCATKKIPGVVPQQSWYISTPFQMLLGGLVPCITIFQDMDNIYATLWAKKVCGATVTMISVFTKVTVTTIVVGVVFTYIQLTQHVQQWWWVSVLRGGSTAIFLYAYGLYYYPRAVTDEWLRLYLLVLGCPVFYSLFLALGAVGFFASYAIYKIKYRSASKNE